MQEFLNPATKFNNVHGKKYWHKISQIRIGIFTQYIIKFTCGFENLIGEF